ncbi:MAG TPA: class I SAM-dependent methyltransferase [Terriglobales bacterium]|nr:class I SAM-dependent methyltransferase [Terriglobales bacterium]
MQKEMDHFVNDSMTATDTTIGTEAREWQAFFERKDYPREYQGNPAIVREIKSLFDTLEGRALLEVGPGSGVDSARLAEAGARSYVVDPTSIALQRIQQSYRDKIDCIQGDGFSLPFADGTFDLVFSQGLLEHFPDPIQMLEEQIRVTRRGGFVIVDVPQTYSLWTVKKKVMQAMGKWFVSYETQYSERRLRKLIRRVPSIRTIRMYGHKLCPSLLPQPRGEFFERSWLARHMCVSIGIIVQRTV